MRSPSIMELPNTWRSVPRRWGHTLHSLCSYMAMFPPAMPNVFIKWLTVPGDVVYDPFSGRGTTALEACLLGRVGYASDANPLAQLLSRAKVDVPSGTTIERRLRELRRLREIWPTDDVPKHIRGLFDRDTLGELLWLRSELDTSRRTDAFVMAALAGILHRNANRSGEPRGLTVAMPNTFAMAPQYVAGYVTRHRLKPPKVSPTDRLAERCRQLQLPQLVHRGASWHQDARSLIVGPVRKEPAKLVFTSPPYLEVMKYAKFNWIRLWLLGKDPRSIDEALFASSSLPKYLDFMAAVVARLLRVTRPDGYVTLVLGDVARGLEEVRLADQVADHLEARLPIRLLGTVVDDIPTTHKVSRIWGPSRGRATRTDRILILTHEGGPDLPPLPQGLQVGYDS